MLVKLWIKKPNKQKTQQKQQKNKHNKTHNIMSAICSHGKETLGHMDPPAMNLNKVRENITDYYTSIIIAVIDNVVGQIMWWHVWSKGQWHSWWDGKPHCCDVMGWCPMAWYAALVNQDWFGLQCTDPGLFCMWQLCRIYLQVVQLQPFQEGLLNFTDMETSVCWFR